MTKLAQLIATQEGFFVTGTLPQRNNNPGDLRHSPNSTHPCEPDDIGVIDTVEHGWDDLERQLRLYADRGLNLEDSIYEFAPPADGNDSVAYLAFVLNGLNGLNGEYGDIEGGTPLSRVLEIQA